MRTPTTFPRAGAFLLCAVTASSALGGFTPSLETPLPPDPDSPRVVSQTGQWFGVDVAIHGDTAVVGAQGEVSDTGLIGAAYVFRRQAGSWILDTKFLPTTGSSSVYGAAVAVSSDCIVVGDNNDDQRGVVYVYARGTDGSWANASPPTLLRPTVPHNYQHFGFDVAVDGQTIVVGAPGDFPVGYGDGAAYVFERDPGSGAWLETRQLTTSVPSGYEAFGSAVDLQGTTVAVGAPDHTEWPDEAVSDGAVSGGAVYIFDLASPKPEWPPQMETHLLLGSRRNDSGKLGWSVALDGATLLAGAPGLDAAQPMAGAALVFTRIGDSWSHTATIEATDGRIYSMFGYSVDLSSGVAVVGSPEDSLGIDPSGEDAVGLTGSVYLADLANSAVPVKLLPHERVPGQRLGFSVSFDGNALLAGGPGCLFEECPPGSDLDGVALLFEAPSNQAPIADASATVTEVVSANGMDAVVMLDGTKSSDPDGDSLSAEWLDAAGNAVVIGLEASVTLPLGTTALRLRVSDGSLTAEDPITITVRSANQPPVAQASPSLQRVIAGNNRDAVVRLDGSASADPDGDPLTYEWQEKGKRLSGDPIASVRLPIGTHTIRLIVHDGQATDSATVVAKVVSLQTAMRSLNLRLAAAKLPRGKKVAAIAVALVAERAFAKDRTALGAHQLVVLQRLLSTRGVDRAVAAPLIAEAQQIIDAVKNR